ncbi:unnamed protein product [Tetraodon nigroviridis]|uniref:(spotted green pufferfish) hypothetical protein n=1 Tax=Tetraodon nigroviridis TaxID=99883 RepID=Q4RWY0_TETNG|nr:unnamed protein product [Tetraodon nigroviridis]
MKPLRTMAAACGLFLGLCIITNSRTTEPTRAYCKVVWLVGVPCPQVQTAIVSQIKAMGSYQLGPVTPTSVQANHTSAVGQMEAVNFTIIPTTTAAGCHIQGSSMSAFWLSLFDNGTNYCNLRNVMKGRCSHMSTLTDSHCPH